MVLRHPDPGETPAAADLSVATKLKKVELDFNYAGILWTSTTLRTIRSNSLRQIIISYSATFGREPEVTEETLPEWRELDRLLVQFYTSHSIRPKLVGATDYLKDLLPELFPELTGRGAIDVQHTTWW